jgi:poly(A) polymerase
MANKQAAIKIIKRLRRAGFEALLAGGCVRDMVLVRPAKDFDVATSARPKEVIKLFERTIKVGVKFGVIIVLLGESQVEVATFRTEADYADGRHPSNVEFSNAAEDAKRRDFTINGMFYDPIEKHVIDYVSGQADLKSKIIRTIGEPKERFDEDYLRMLRAVRFSTQLGFKIEAKTKAAVCSNARFISNISGERIAMELAGILTDPNRSTGAALLLESGLALVIFPGFGGNCAKLAVRTLSELRKNVGFALALAGFFAGCDTDYAVEKSRTLKLSRNHNKHLMFLLSNRGRLLNEQMSLAQLKLILAEPYFNDLYELQRAIQKATGESVSSLTRLRKRIKALGDIDLKPPPLLNGHDLIRLGAVPGPTLGRLAEEMYIAQLEGTLKNAVQASEWVEKWLQKNKMTDK